MDNAAIMKRVLKRCGCTSATLARVMGTSRSNLDTWRKRGVPAKWVIKLAMCASISPSFIRPDLYPKDLKLTNEDVKK